MIDDDMLAGEPIDAIDEQILAELAAAFTVADPVPDGMVDRMQFAISMQAIEAEVAELLTAPEPVGVRTEAFAEVETVTFTSKNINAMVSISDDRDGGARIDGWVTGGGVDIELRVGGEVFTEQTDANGRFVFAGVPHGLAQFVFRHVSGDQVSTTPVITPTIQI